LCLGLSTYYRDLTCNYELRRSVVSVVSLYSWNSTWFLFTQVYDRVPWSLHNSLGILTKCWGNPPMDQRGVAMVLVAIFLPRDINGIG